MSDNRSNEEVYEDWLDYIKKRNTYYKSTKNI